MTDTYRPEAQRGGVPPRPGFPADTAPLFAKKRAILGFSGLRIPSRVRP